MADKVWERLPRLWAVAVFPEAVAEVFESIARDFTEQGCAFVTKIPQTIEAVRGQWQFCTVSAGWLCFVFARKENVCYKYQLTIKFAQLFGAYTGSTC